MNSEEAGVPKSDDKPATTFAVAEYQFLRKEIESSVEDWNGEYSKRALSWPLG